jgi:hypothetical protein
MTMLGLSLPKLTRRTRADQSGLKGHILAIIPRGEVVRNFVYTGCFEEIAKEMKLSLMSVGLGAEIDGLLRRTCDRVYELEEIQERWIVRFQREILDVAHGRWLWSAAAQERWRLRDSEARTIRQKAVRLAKKSIGIPFANNTGLDILSRTERMSSFLLRSTQQYVDLYRQIKPTVVFNGSHIHSRNAIQAVQAAQWLGIPTATFVFSWDNLTSQGRITLPYDYFLVWNESIKQQLLEMYSWIKPEDVFVTGTPQFDFHFRDEFYLTHEEYCKRIGADVRRPIIFYATGMANHMPGEPEIVEAIADILADTAKFPDRPQLMVRVYAKDMTGRFDELKQRRSDILFPEVPWSPSWLTPMSEDSVMLVNTLRHCALGINVASTLSLELCMFDKPVINVAFNPPSVKEDILSYSDYYEFDHYKPVVDSGAVSLARSPGEMEAIMVKYLKNPSYRSVQRKEIIGRMFGATLDGASSGRVAKVLLRLSDLEKRGRSSLL